MVRYDELAEKYLETYSLEELLELCDITHEDVVYFLLRDGLIPDNLEVTL